MGWKEGTNILPLRLLRALQRQAGSSNNARHTSNSSIALAEATNGRAAPYHMANRSGEEAEKVEEKGEEAEVEAMEAAEVVEEVVVVEEAKKNRRNRSIWCHCALGCIPVKVWILLPLSSVTTTTI